MLYYMFQFWDELDLLDAQLNENYDYVDKFVITECDYSWTLKKKPLYYQNNKDRFSKFSDKIIHLVCDISNVVDFPEDAITNNFTESEILRGYWAREYVGRYYPFKMLNLNSDDNVLITDADMIVDLKKIKDKLIWDKLNIFQMEEHFYYYDAYSGDKNYSPIAYNLGKFPKFPHCWMQLYPTRFLSIDKDQINYIPDSAWHFSWMGGLEHSLLKIEYTSHQDVANGNMYRESVIDMYINRKFKLQKMDDLILPAYIKNNINTIYKKYFLQLL